MMGTVVSGVVTRRDLVSQKRPKGGLTWSAPVQSRLMLDVSMSVDP